LVWVVGQSYQGRLETANTKLEDANGRLEEANDDLDTANLNLTNSLAETERARAAEEKAKNELGQILYIRRIHSALGEWNDGEPARARQLLDGCPPARRGWEWHYAYRVCHPELLSYVGHAGSVCNVAFSPEGTQFVSASADGTLKLWETATGQETLTSTGHSGCHQCGVQPGWNADCQREWLRHPGVGRRDGAGDAHAHWPYKSCP
jgi:hypothetical protein